MGLSGNKVFLTLSSRETVLARTVRSILDADVCRGVVLVVRESDLPEAEKLLLRLRESSPALDCIAALGGATRQESVLRGLEALDGTAARWVLVHDGARPFCPPALIRAVADRGRETGAAILATPARQTLKRSADGRRIELTVPRAEMWEAQTPQVFDYDLLLRAHRHAERTGFAATDDSQLVEELGHPVNLVAGEDRNIKITTPFDLAMARAVIADELPEPLVSPGRTAPHVEYQSRMRNEE
jgi:2-C-methyl-D-erythritol 4-phosphate cytidylyltransferase